jgi:hypothetical protein
MFENELLLGFKENDELFAYIILFLKMCCEHYLTIFVLKFMGNQQSTLVFQGLKLSRI